MEPELVRYKVMGHIAKIAMAHVAAPYDKATRSEGRY